MAFDGPCHDNFLNGYYHYNNEHIGVAVQS